MEAWILNRLVSILNRTAKRAHVPRNKAVKELLVACGIDLGSLSRTKSYTIYIYTCVDFSPFFLVVTIPTEPYDNLPIWHSS